MSPKRVIDILHKEIRGLHEAAYLLAFFTFGSQIFALVRDRLLAHNFGAGETLDVFYAAFRIPDTIYALLASMVSLFVLIPFIEAAQKKGDTALRDFLSNMFSFFSVALVLLGGIAWTFAPQIVEILYGNFSVSMQADLVTLVRILLLQPLLLGTSNLFAAYVQVRGRFLLYAIAPILYNIGIIFGIIFLYPYFGISGLAWGVVLGAIMHLGIQSPYMAMNNMVPRFVMPDWEKVIEVVKISIPRTITLSSQQIVFLFMISLASLFTAGSVSSFSFAWNLQAVPLALIGVSYSVAAFPKLTHIFEKKKLDEFRDLILVASRQIIFWALPTIVFFVVLRAHIVRLVLGSGEFDWYGTRMTAAILALFVLSLVAQGLIVLLVRACYASGKTLVPLIMNVTSALFTVFLAYALLHLADTGVINLTRLASIMRVEGVFSSEVLLIAMAYSAGAFLNAGLLIAYFEKKYKTVIKGLFHTSWQSLVASVFAGYGAYLALNLMDDIVHDVDTFIELLAQGFVAGLVGACIWMATLIATGNKDIVAAWTALQSRFTRQRVGDARGPIEGN